MSVTPRLSSRQQVLLALKLSNEDTPGRESAQESDYTPSGRKRRSDSVKTPRSTKKSSPSDSGKAKKRKLADESKDLATASVQNPPHPDSSSRSRDSSSEVQASVVIDEHESDSVQPPTLASNPATNTDLNSPSKTADSNGKRAEPDTAAARPRADSLHLPKKIHHRFLAEESSRREKEQDMIPPLKRLKHAELAPTISPSVPNGLMVTTPRGVGADSTPNLVGVSSGDAPTLTAPLPSPARSSIGSLSVSSVTSVFSTPLGMSSVTTPPAVSTAVSAPNLISGIPLKLKPSPPPSLTPTSSSTLTSPSAQFSAQVVSHPLAPPLPAGPVRVPIAGPSASTGAGAGLFPVLLNVSAAPSPASPAAVLVPPPPSLISGVPLRSDHHQQQHQPSHHAKAPSTVPTTSSQPPMADLPRGTSSPHPSPYRRPPPVPFVGTAPHRHPALNAPTRNKPPAKLETQPKSAYDIAFEEIDARLQRLFASVKQEDATGQDAYGTYTKAFGHIGALGFGPEVPNMKDPEDYTHFDHLTASGDDISSFSPHHNANTDAATDAAWNPHAEEPQPVPSHQPTPPAISHTTPIQPMRLFVGNLTPDITADKLRDICLIAKISLSTVTNVNVPPHQLHPKKFGFVEFMSKETAAEALSRLSGLVTSVNDHRPLIVDFAKTTGTAPARDRDREAIEPRAPTAVRNPVSADQASMEVVVRNLPERFTNHELRAMFSDVATVVRANVLMGRTMGFVTFQSTEAVDRAVREKNNLLVEGRHIDVRPNNKARDAHREPHRDSYRESYRDGYRDGHRDSGERDSRDRSYTGSRDREHERHDYRGSGQSSQPVGSVQVGGVTNLSSTGSSYSGHDRTSSHSHPHSHPHPHPPDEPASIAASRRRSRWDADVSTDAHHDSSSYSSGQQSTRMPPIPPPPGPPPPGPPAIAAYHSSTSKY